MKELLLRVNIALFFVAGVGAHSMMLCKEDTEGSLYLRKYIASKCLERYTPSCQSSCGDPIDRFMDAQERISSNKGLFCCMTCCGIPLCMFLMFASYIVIKSNFPSIV